MATYIALLRGVNVGGRKVPMADLRELCESLRLKNVRTFIQSGNIVLEYAGSSVQLEDLLDKAITKRFGFDVKVTVRTPSDLSAVIKSNPFGNEAYVVFLSSESATIPTEAINKAKAAKEEFIFLGKEIYLNLPNGYGQTKITNNFFESKLKIPATTRNMRTIKALLEMSQS